MSDHHNQGRRHARWLNYIAAALVLAGVIATASAVIFLHDAGTVIEKTQSTAEYQSHVAIITENPDTQLWPEICRAAAEEGAANGVLVEQTGADLDSSLPIDDAINMAIYENVDGILLLPSNGYDTISVINRAVDLGIPVITLQRDVSGSRRQGFVGINSYFLGQQYALKILQYNWEDAERIIVLLPESSFDESGRSWFTQGFGSTLTGSGLSAEYEVIYNDETGLSNAEDRIHSLIDGENQTPDILVCLDSVTTQSAYQSVEDSSLKGKVHIIGSGIEGQILQGILDGGISCSIAIDPESLGRLGIDAMMQYRSYHMTSYYTEVKTVLIDQSNAASYLENQTEEVDDAGS